MRYRLGGLLGEFFRIDADRKYRDARCAVARGDDAVFDLEAEIGREISEEIVAIVLGLESDQIVGQHRLDQFAMMRHAADHGARRPRRMQEEADRLGDAEIAQFRAQRQEMIILNPERRLRLLEAQQRPRHEGVDFAIGKIIVLRGADQIGCGNAAPATTPNSQNLHNSRRNARPADPASPARRRPALRFRRTVPSGRRRGPGRWNPPKSRRISPPPATKRLQAPPSWVRWPCRARRDLKRRRGSQGPLLMAARVLTTIHQYGSSSPFQRNETKFGLAPSGTRRFQRKNASNR